MNTSVKAYQQVCKHLGVKPAKVTEAELKEVPNTSTVIVPNQVFEWDKLKELAGAFGKDQPYSTYTYDNLYKEYTAKQLSGPVLKDLDYRVVYIPHAYNVKADSVENQHKDNKGHVPSVLEAICYWYSLRAEGVTLDFDTTYIRHFDLPIKKVANWPLVPDSYVYDVGRPCLVDSDAERRFDARLAVGDFDASSLPESSNLELTVSELTFNGRVYRLVEES